MLTIGNGAFGVIKARKFIINSKSLILVKNEAILLQNESNYLGFFERS